MTEIDYTNIQGDILQGLPKKTQLFLFYRFTDQGALRFRRRLHEIIPLIKTAEQVISDRSNIRAHKEGGNAQLLPVSAVNIAFSQAGLKSMDLDEQFEHEVDEPFDIGQLADAPFLNDLDTSEWEPAFNDPTKLVHLLIFIAGDSRDSVQAEVSQLELKLSIAEAAEPALQEVLRLWGDVRPGDQAGHEHFGYLDGISNPSIEGLPPTPNSSPPFPRSFLLFGECDPGPSWAMDGSFLVFRYLKQLVPELDEFLERNAPLVGYDGEDGKELLGAKLVGRWKSGKCHFSNSLLPIVTRCKGAPVDLSPLKDDPSLALSNGFSYLGEESQARCPYGAHIRTTNPRDDTTTPSPLIRRGIPYGPEVTQEERVTRKTQHERGLLFVCYQRSIASGFRTIQRHWANDPDFPHDETGFDPIIGRCPANAARKMRGVVSNDAKKELLLPFEFVLPLGGEYFFSPSIHALRSILALRDVP